MKRLVCVAIASLTVACGNHGADSRSSGGAAQSARQAQAGAQSNEPGPEAASPSGAASGVADRQQQRVTLTGCLRGGESVAGAAGTAGRTPAQPASGAAGAVNGAGGGFMLTNARPADAAPSDVAPAPRAGVGANGAGGSGGPLVSGVSNFLLSGSTPELQAHVNEQVRISGTINPRETIADAPRPGNRGTSETAPATSGTAGSGVGAPGSSPAESQAARGTSPNAAIAATAARHVSVESIQRISARCE